MLFDPSEEEFDFPAAAVQFGKGEWGKGELIGEKNQGSILFDIMVFDAPELFRIVGGSVKAGEQNGLIADQSGGAVDGMGIEATESGVGFGPQ